MTLKHAGVYLVETRIFSWVETTSCSSCIGAGTRPGHAWSIPRIGVGPVTHVWVQQWDQTRSELISIHTISLVNYAKSFLAQLLTNLKWMKPVWEFNETSVTTLQAGERFVDSNQAAWFQVYVTFTVMESRFRAHEKVSYIHSLSEWRLNNESRNSDSAHSFCFQKELPAWCFSTSRWRQSAGLCKV